MGNPLTAVPMRAARWSAEHPWRAILAWVAFVAVAVGLAVAVSTTQTTDADFRHGESGRADAMVADAGLTPPDTENVLVEGPGRRAAAADLVATVPERHTANLREGMHSFPLPIETPGFTVSLLWHPRLDADPAHRWLRGLVRAACGASR